MNVTIIGTGNMASAFVKRLSIADHRVAITGRDLAKASELAAQFANARAVQLSAAAQEADVIILATPYEAAAAALNALGNLDGKVVVDITNPLTADYMGLTVGHTTSAAEEIAKAVPGALIVKGFNTIFAQVLGRTDISEGVETVFVASDNDAAKKTVRALAESVQFKTLDAGPLKNARYLEPLAGLNIYFGYGAGLGTGIAPTWNGAA